MQDYQTSMYGHDMVVSFNYIPGRPAHTPRGEYAPIDPPDPPEIDIRRIEIMGKTGDWRSATALEFDFVSERLLNDEFDDMCESTSTW